MIRTPTFWQLWFCFFFNAQGIIFIASFEKTFGLKIVPGGLSDVMLTSIAAWASMFNATGRLFWGSLGDLFGFKNTMIGLCCVEVTFLYTLPLCWQWYTYFAWTCIIFCCVGGNMALFPKATAEYFGAKNVGSNYGPMFMAAGTSMVVGSFLSAELMMMLSVPQLAHLVAALAACGMACVLTLPNNPKKISPLNQPMLKK